MKFEDGLGIGDSFYRKIEPDDKITVQRFIYGLGFDGSRNYSAFNVSLVRSGQISINRATSNSYRIQGDVLENGEMVYGSQAPVILVDYSPGDNDFGIRNAKIKIDRLNGRGNKEI